MNEWLLLALAILACYRLARFTVYEEGPWQFMTRIRSWAGTYDYGENGEPKSSLGRLFACPYCTGMWIALALAIIFFWQRPSLLPLLWFGIAGGQAFLQGLVERR
jgi:hypothetical protein